MTVFFGPTARIVSVGFAILASLNLVDAAEAGTASFTGLGFLNASYPSSTNPYVNADGTVVAGTSNYASEMSEAFLWTQSGGAVALGFVKRTNQSAAESISGNGLVVGGNASGSGSGEIPEIAFRWSEATGMEQLNDGRIGSTVFGLNKNGAVLAGSDGEEAFRWVKGEKKAQLLGFLGIPSGSTSGYSFANGMDSTGDYVVGSSSTTTQGQSEAYIWNGGMTGLGFPPSDTISSANGISGDSKTVVGYGRPTTLGINGETTAFYWTTLSGIQPRSAPAGLPYTIANAVNEHGTIIVGCATASTTQGVDDQAIMWNNKGVPKTIAAIAAQNGLSTTGWTLTCATSVSASGKTIVGNGIDPDGHNEAWILQLP